MGGYNVECMGNSLTNNAAWGYTPDLCWPGQLQNLMQAAGVTVTHRNRGLSGTTTNMNVLRMIETSKLGFPKLGIIFDGVNDPGGPLYPSNASQPSVSGTTATYLNGLAYSAGLMAGDSVTWGGATPSGYNGTYSVASVNQPQAKAFSATNFTFSVTALGTPSVYGTLSSAIAATRTVANLQAMAQFWKYGASGFADTQASLPNPRTTIGLTPGTIYIVRNDTSTSGGLAGTLGSSGQTGALSTPTGAAFPCSAWQLVGGGSATSFAPEGAWARLSAWSSTKWIVPRILLVTPQFLNYTSGADTAAAAGSHSGQNATYLAINNAVVQAGANESVPVCDLYAYQENLVLTGLEAARSGSWHVNGGVNQHPTQEASYVWAQAIMATLSTQGWVN